MAAISAVGTSASAVASSSASPVGIEAADRVSAALAQAGVDQTPASVATSRVSIASNRPALTISLPSGAVTLSLLTAHQSASVETATGRVHTGVAPNTDVVVRATGPDTGQILAVLNEPTASSEQRYSLELPAGVRLAPLAGGFLLVDSNDQPVGTIAAPWAKDATGRFLPTSYTLDGSTLVQQTDTSNAKFPVVVDPKLTYGLGIYLNLWGWEVQAYATAMIAVLGSGITVSCTLIGKLPHQILRSLATLVCGAVALNLRDLFDLIVYLWNNELIPYHACYQTRILPANYSWVQVNPNNCQ